MIALFLFLLISLAACNQENETISVRLVTNTVVNNNLNVAFTTKYGSELPPIKSVKIVESKHGILEDVDLTGEDGEQALNFSFRAPEDFSNVRMINGYAAFEYKGVVELTFDKKEFEANQEYYQTIIAKSPFGVKYLIHNYYTGGDQSYSFDADLDVAAIENLGDYELQLMDDQYLMEKYVEHFFASKQQLVADKDFQEIINHLNTGGTEEEVARYLFDYVKSNVTYDREFQELVYSQPIEIGSTKGVLKTLSTGKGICQDMAHVYKVLLDQFGIKNKLAIGNFVGKENYADHMWNEVLINGDWILVDTTGSSFDVVAPERYKVMYYAEDTTGA